MWKKLRSDRALKFYRHSIKYVPVFIKTLPFYAIKMYKQVISKNITAFDFVSIFRLNNFTSNALLKLRMLCTSKLRSFVALPGINDLCGKRDELHKQIMQEEEEKQKLQNDIRILTERLAKVNESLSKKMASRNEFDKTIAETENAYMKVNSCISCHTAKTTISLL